jgi:DNA-binding transcriptional LysR family regulator
MQRETLSDLVAFLAVAQERSFTRAAARLGLSQSGLSHVINGLEARLGVRLLARTTRTVAPTDAGAQLLEKLAPMIAELDEQLAQLATLRDRPSGLIRITVGDHPVEFVLMPRIGAFLSQWPEVALEISVDAGLTDIVAKRFDAGIRLGEQVDRDMIAVPVSPPMRFAAVATPGYLHGREPPLHPQDLTSHRCLNLRLQSQGGLYAWEFAKGGRALRVRVEGPLIASRAVELLQGARMGLGIAYVPEDRVVADLASGVLVRFLEDWCPEIPGYHLYYPSRRQPSAAFARLIDHLRWRSG